MAKRDPLAEYRRFVVGNYAPLPAVLTRGRGARVYDSAGGDYVDFAGGIAVSSLGHAHSGLSAAIGSQAARLIHVSNLFVHDRLVATAKNLVRATGMRQAFFCNSGAEANECALKLARKRGVAMARAKYKVVALQGSFHGRVGLALAASGQPRLRQGFGPLAPGFVHVAADAKALRAAFDDKVCAAIVEPIQGEAGVREIAPQLLVLLRRLCAEHAALLICDEVQTGMGRTGRLLCTAMREVRPDIVTLGKGLGGGLPVAAALVARQAAGVLRPGDHGTTYGGNPLALAAVEQVLAQLAKGGFLRKVSDKGRYVRTRLAAMVGRGAPIAQVRGRGLMLGLRLAAQLPAAEAFVRAMRCGVLVAPAGDNVVRLLPPLNATKQEIDLGLRRLEQALRG